MLRVGFIEKMRNEERLEGDEELATQVSSEASINLGSYISNKEGGLCNCTGMSQVESRRGNLSNYGKPNMESHKSCHENLGKSLHGLELGF